nr:MAG TPA: hypothetical protein [Caudoviricetes sp.]
MSTILTTKSKFFSPVRPLPDITPILWGYI